MDPEIEKIIKEQMEKLPDEVKKLFTDPELGDKIINIGKKNGLNIEQLGILQTETNLVMLGLVHPGDYSNELKNHLNINDLRANNITDDVNKEILSGILEKLKETYEKTDEVVENDYLQTGLTGDTPLEFFGKPTNNQQVPTKNDKDILNKAGIEIINGNEKEKLPIPEKLELNSPPEEYPSGGGGQILHPGASATPQEGNNAHPILTQKLSGFTKSDVVETQHSLDNITKTNILTPPGAPVNKPTIDPYREKPE